MSAADPGILLSEMKVSLSVSTLNEPVCFISATDEASMSSSNFPDSMARFMPTCLSIIFTERSASARLRCSPGPSRTAQSTVA